MAHPSFLCDVRSGPLEAGGSQAVAGHAEDGRWPRLLTITLNPVPGCALPTHTTALPDKIDSLTKFTYTFTDSVQTFNQKVF